MFQKLLAPIAVIGMLVGSGVSVDPARADNVPAGLDYFYTPADACVIGVSGSYLRFGTNSPALPAGFFGPTSDPFTGDVCFRGSPLGSYENADTVIQRLNPLNFDCACGPTCDATVPIEIVALSLVSVNPITVNFSGGGMSKYQVEVTLSNAPQDLGSLTVVHSCLEGGTFTSTLPVKAKLTFRRVSGTDGELLVELDHGNAALPMPTFTVTNGFWSHTGAGIPVVQNSTFYPGIRWTSCDCVAGGNHTAEKALTLEQELWAQHGVQVHNDDKEIIPTVSEWGVLTLVLLMMAAATIVLKKRLAMA